MILVCGFRQEMTGHALLAASVWLLVVVRLFATHPVTLCGMRVRV